jgi:hypothetical protein
VVMDVLTCFDRRAVGAHDGTGYGRSASCPKIATPSRFRLVGLFRSQSRNWTPPPGVDPEEDGGVRDTSRSPVLLKKKKMRVLV